MSVFCFSVRKYSLGFDPQFLVRFSKILLRQMLLKGAVKVPYISGFKGSELQVEGGFY